MDSGSLTHEDGGSPALLLQEVLQETDCAGHGQVFEGHRLPMEKLKDGEAILQLGYVHRPRHRKLGQRIGNEAWRIGKTQREGD